MSEKRDIAADRKVLAELHWGGWYEPLHLASFAEKALPHYLTRTEEAESALSHERRKVDAAVEYMTHGTNGFEHGICGLCPLGPNTDCRAITATDCKRLVHDYLDAKAKEGAK